MSFSQLHPFLFGALLAIASAPAGAAAEKTPDSALGFSRAQISQMSVCAGAASFATAAFSSLESGQTIEEAKAGTEGLDPKSREISLAQIDRTYGAKPTDVREWANSTFAACLSENSIPVEAADAAICYNATFWVSMMVSLRLDQSREEVIDAIVADKKNATMRDMVGSEFDVQKLGDNAKTHAHSIALFARCASTLQAKRAADAAARKP